ncbi:tRNA (adenosine(37)-N6)-dimethylallyltransferase MiaA [bacterium]|nr:MAG: tRNA (adenosine(37)-N6)-dimethylallyltransferase MiaA [bacterium]
MEKPRIIFLVGPTAIGKTESAIYLSRMINAEIISCDSMQIYKKMDIISSKPPLSLRRKIPHHLIDIISPAKEYNVSRFFKEASLKVNDILKRGKIPLLVGGSGLYMSILIDGIFEQKAADKNIRLRLFNQAKRLGNSYLHDRLEKIDPESAARIHLHDTKRIIRALEVFEVTGKPISLLKQQRSGLADKYQIKIFALKLNRNKLYEKINQRVEGMFENGLINEVKGLLKSKLSSTASYAIGLRELKGFFEGLYDLEETKEQIKHNTRLYAKRQLTWFKKDKRIVWIKVGSQEKPRETAKKIWKRLY